jgi:hydroxypyruvate reductase
MWRCVSNTWMLCSKSFFIMAESRLSSQQLREDGRRIFAAGVAAVDPVIAVQRVVTCQDDILCVDGRTYDLRHYDHIYVVGGGKAGATMAQGLEAVLGRRITAGSVTVKYAHLAPVSHITLHEAGHPIPDAAGVQGAADLIRLAEQAGGHDLVFCLLSGGASALLPAPVAGISLAEKQQVTSLLLQCGASIEEINTIRKHISRLKGGQLARLLAPATLITLVLSDVVGDRLDAIASGPTVPDPTTYQDCLEIVTRYDLLQRLPHSVRAHLQAGQAQACPETPTMADTAFDRCQTAIVGSNRIALQAAREAAQALGYATLILSSSIEGETRDIACLHAAIMNDIRPYGEPLVAPACVISGGETTVTLRGDGKGGRNQEFVLAAALAIDGLDNVVVLSAGTDGTDGPTTAAGAACDGQTVRHARRLGMEAQDFLLRNDAYHFFNRLDDLLITGPTGTKICDPE